MKHCAPTLSVGTLICSYKDLRAYAYIWEYEEIVDIFRGSSQDWTISGVISMLFMGGEGVNVKVK